MSAHGQTAAAQTPMNHSIDLGIILQPGVVEGMHGVLDERARSRVMMVLDRQKQ